MENITVVDFSDGKANKTVTNAPYQWSYGQILRITGLELPDGIEIHFSLSEKVGIAYRVPGANKDGATEVKIPQFIFENEGTRRESYKGYVFIYPSDPDSGETTHKIILNIKTRPKPEDYIYNEEELATYKALEERILELEEKQSSDETIKEAVEDYLEKNPVEIEVDETLSEVSENPVQNKTVTKAIKDVEGKIPTDYVSNKELESRGYLTEHQSLDAYAKKSELPTAPEAVGADAKGTADAKVSAHNTSDTAHNDIRLLIKNLTSKVTTLLDSDDETLDQTSEIVSYIKSNKTLIEAITTSKVSVTDIVDNLTTNLSNKTLSAKQGAVLKGLIDDVQTALNKIVIPSKLPNPQKLTFAGAISAEYDGSGAVVVTIPNRQSTERIEKDAVDTDVTLEPNKLYIFPEMATLNITLSETVDTAVANEFHFVFQSSATATTLILPDTVALPDGFSVDANKIYEISILENMMLAQSWAVSE